MGRSVLQFGRVTHLAVDVLSFDVPQASRGLDKTTLSTALGIYWKYTMSKAFMAMESFEQFSMLGRRAVGQTTLQIADEAHRQGEMRSFWERFNLGRNSSPHANVQRADRIHLRKPIPSPWESLQPHLATRCPAISFAAFKADKEGDLPMWLTQQLSSRMASAYEASTCDLQQGSAERLICRSSSRGSS